jgi:hypothetical protein
MDPEGLGGREGLVCPSCGADLKPTDLFGLADAFVEEDAPDVSLDDLVPGRTGPVSVADRDEMAPASSALELMKRMKKKR